jgi:hypothetical protein
VPRVGDGLGHTEVGHHCRVARQQHVVRLDVAVHHPARVRHGERAGHVAQNADGVHHRQRPARETCSQRLPFNEGHEEVRQPIELAGIEHRDDERMLQRCRRTDFAPKALEAHSRCQLRAEHLDGDAAVEPPIVGHIHPRHTPAHELPLEGEIVSKVELQGVGSRQEYGW